MAEASVRKYRHGLPYFAEVVLDVDTRGAQQDIVFACSGKGFSSQGHIEDVPPTGYDDWREGARAGISFALSAVGATGRVIVRRISGLMTDTNPTIVAVAAAHAVWNGLGLSPPAEVSARLEHRMLSSWQRPHDEIPTFT